MQYIERDTHMYVPRTGSGGPQGCARDWRTYSAYYQPTDPVSTRNQTPHAGSHAQAALLA